MAIIAKSEGNQDFSPIPEGVYTAVAYSIIDMGLQYSEMYQKSTRKVMVTWELPDETIEVDGQQKPRAISKEYSLSLADKANLRKDLEAWRGKKFTDDELSGFDLRNVMGRGCQVQIVHTEKNGKQYANINAIMALPKGMKVALPVNDTIYFDMSEPDTLNLLTKIPQWIQDKITKSETYKELMASVNAGHDVPVDDTDDDLPF